MRTGLSYNDVCLIPKFNNISSRSKPDLSTWLTKNLRMKVPFVAANMDTVIGPDLAKSLYTCGSFPIFHRFYKDPSELIKLVKKYKENCFISWGVNDAEQLIPFIEKNNLRPAGVCFDIAHGHSKVMLTLIESVRKTHPSLEIIAGNICTAQAFHDLVNAGATSVKVGIGPGSVCTTRNVTAFGSPQFTSIQDCAKISRELKVPFIADGGIRGSREVILALAAGASSVMIGRIFAGTKEAAGKGVYRGQASREFQEDFYGKVKKGTVPEGMEVDLYDTEWGSLEDLPKAEDVIEELLGGIRSGMTYGGALTIKELQRKAEFMRITESYF